MRYTYMRKKILLTKYWLGITFPLLTSVIVNAQNADQDWASKKFEYNREFTSPSLRSLNNEFRRDSAISIVYKADSIYSISKSVPYENETSVGGLVYIWNQEEQKWDMSSKSQTEEIEKDGKFFNYRTTFTWDTIQEEFVANKRYEIIKNAAGKTLESNVQDPIESATNEWAYFRKFEYEYDNQNFQTKFIVKLLRQGPDTLYLSQWTDFTKNDQGRVVEDIRYSEVFWDKGKYRATKTETFYAEESLKDAPEFITGELEFPANYSRTLQLYDDNDLLTSETRWRWDIESELWLPFIKKELEYNTLKFETSRSDYYWNSITGKFEISGKSETVYNDNGQRTQITRTNYKEDSSYLVSKDIIEYDDYGNIVKREYYDTDFETQQFGLANVVEYYYSRLIVNSSPGISQEEIKIFPNPSHADISIQSSQSNTFLNLELTDHTGKMVFQGPVMPGEKINVQQLNTGIYYYKVFDGKNMLSGKLVKD